MGDNITFGMMVTSIEFMKQFAHARENMAPPADAKEWTCEHGWDALWCTICEANRSVRAETVPIRRAISRTGEVPVTWR